MAATSRTCAMFVSKGHLFKHLSYNRFTRFRHLHLQLKNSSKFITPEMKLDKISIELNSGGQVITHSGIMRNRCITVSSRLENTVNILIEKYPLKNLVATSESFARFLWGRHIPIEINEKRKKLKEITAKVLEKSKTQDLNDALERKLQQKIIYLMKEQTYNWQSIKYDAYKSFLYMVSRMPANYAAVLLCLDEIVKRVPDYKPRNVFDFGSGTGSTIWACNKIWNEHIFEYLAHDISADMNILCRLLLQDGEQQKEMHIPGVYLRQFMPTQKEKLYNLVVCSYSLFELESRQARLKVIHNLWDLTEDFLIVIENGTNAGFQLISEVRETILKKNSESSDEATVFAPCPHNLPCPMNKESKKIPCNFEVTFKQFDFVKKNKKITERFCYIILQKGKRKDVLGTNWPRILQTPRKHSKNIHLKTCCPNGEIEHSFLTVKKNGKEAYKCASRCKWGDLLPMVPQENPQTALDTTKSTPKTEPDTEKEDNLNENNKENLIQETKQIVS